MKVLLINGSARKDGCTYLALAEVAKALKGEGVETEIVQMGSQPVREVRWRQRLCWKGPVCVCGRHGKRLAG